MSCFKWLCRSCRQRQQIHRNELHGFNVVAWSWDHRMGMKAACGPHVCITRSHVIHIHKQSLQHNCSAQWRSHACISTTALPSGLAQQNRQRTSKGKGRRAGDEQLELSNKSAKFTAGGGGPEDGHVLNLVASDEELGLHGGDARLQAPLLLLLHHELAAAHLQGRDGCQLVRLSPPLLLFHLHIHLFSFVHVLFLPYFVLTFSISCLTMFLHPHPPPVSFSCSLSVLDEQFYQVT